VVFGLEKPGDPRRYRLLFLAMLAGAFALIWSAWWVGLRFVEQSAEASLRKRIDLDSLLLEDHVSRTLDIVTARLQSVVALTRPGALGDGSLSPAGLDELIFEDRMLRSLSLVDPAGQVILSSNPANLGTRVPAGTVPDPAAPAGRDGMRFGQLLPYRDLFQIGTAKQPPDVRLWVVSRSVDLDGRTLHWLAVLNPSVFENLWSRLDEDEATELALFDYRGQRIATHHGVVPESVPLGRELIAQAETRMNGSFEPAGAPLWVSFRASTKHPVIVASIGDPGRLQLQLAAERGGFTFAALAATALVMLAVALLYRGYLKYEASVLETANQARAIGAHLMSSESTPDGRIIRVNDALLQATGFTRDEVLGQTHRLFNSGLHTAEFYAGMWKTLASGRIWKGTFRNRRRDGTHLWFNATIMPFHDAWGHMERYVALYTDVSESIVLAERFEKERRMRHELVRVNRDLVNHANTDPLTGAASRRAFDAFTRQVIEVCREQARPLTLLLLDLDGFKQVNDLHGHAAGDEVLRIVTRRWAAQIRGSDLLARLGGEEFCVVLPDTPASDALAVAQSLLAATASAPVHIGSSEYLHITVSVGMASGVIRARGELDHLLQEADAALYQAKHAGRNRVCAAESCELPRLQSSGR